MECSTNEKLSLQPDCLLHAPESRCGLNTAVNTTVIYEHLIENLITGTIIPDSHKLHKVSYFKFALFLNRIFLPMHSLVLFSSVILFLSFFFFFFLSRSVMALYQLENKKVQLNILQYLGF